ncbi:uncharacterized protein TRAVEDRAFT_53086 [Trametes versicolor FP-101664 SS1]|uniref:uncharacterized protein n=1 Tax=Trametes versicolor (strain FP-101664) TaxID=717944 RepID=UPI000462412F|nr:uncharacterized protein TRAVEDRAFT_53086 [Trametes versicolor FP-101664 SS1]EIW52645.1 hypothetical protein TRAVEDRAFT_53086 [Trametes versicolor FP-101664 SS1]
MTHSDAFPATSKDMDATWTSRFKPFKPDQGSSTHTDISVDIPRGGPAPLESPDQYGLWAATSKRLAGLSLEDECMRILEILENGYPNKASPEGVVVDAAASVERFNLPRASTYMDNHPTRPYFYGWPITRKWFRVFAQCASPYSANVPQGGVGYGLTLLKELSGADGVNFDLTQELAVHKKAPVKPEDESEEEEWLADELRFYMVSIWNTLDVPGYFVAWPTRAQYEWLNSILPREPQWYKGFYSRENCITLMICPPVRLVKVMSWR